MRVIPKRTKVRLELFKGVEVVDVLVGSAGIGLAVSVMFSNLPAKYVISMIICMLTLSMVIPLGDDKGYIFILYAIRYFARKREFTKKRILDAAAAEAAEKEAAEAAACLCTCGA